MGGSLPNDYDTLNARGTSVQQEQVKHGRRERNDVGGWLIKWQEMLLKRFSRKHGNPTFSVLQLETHKISFYEMPKLLIPITKFPATYRQLTGNLFRWTPLPITSPVCSSKLHKLALQWGKLGVAHIPLLIP